MSVTSYLSNRLHRFLGTQRQHLHEQRVREQLLQQHPTLTLEPDVVVKSPERLELGEHVLVQRSTILHCGGMDWSHGKGAIRLGNHVAISPNCVFYGSGEITVAEYCRFGPGTQLIAQREDLHKSPLTSQPKMLFQPIVLGRGCQVGAGAVILGGTELGDFCVVGPNTVVQGVYPAKTTLVGNPARKLPRPEFEQEEE